MKEETKEFIEEFIDDIDKNNWQAIINSLADASTIVTSEVVTIFQDLGINFLQNVQMIPISAFYSTDALTHITIPDSVTDIGSDAFGSCDNLEYVKLSENIDSIHTSTFAYCPKLKNVILPSNLKSIQSEAFTDCESLTNLAIPSTVRIIGDNAFYKCKSLTSINLDGVTGVKKAAFYLCSNLKTVKFNTLITLEDSVFGMCKELEEVTFPSTLSSIGSGIFLGGCKFITINFDGTVDQWNNIKKSSNWNTGLIEYSIKCNDGTITKKDEW